MVMSKNRYLISGGTGMIGCALIERLVSNGADVTLLVRDTAKAKAKLTRRDLEGNLKYIQSDLSSGGVPKIQSSFDYIIHLASTTHPKAYVETPIATIALNVLVTKSLLDVAARNQGCRFVYASSVEVYGPNRGDLELFDEK